MAIANKNDLSHIVRTTQQWTTSYDSYECIPEGVLCVEFTPDGNVKAKIGNGHDIFSKLPYIGGADLTNYYTKSETAKCIEEIIKANRFIRIKGILQNKDQLPSHAECGDLYFVISQNQSSSNKYDEYVYSPSNTWENLGSIPIDIDLSEYAKIVYVDEKIDEVNERIDDIEQHGTHTHANKDILDLITAAFTAEEKDKLSTLYNYDDTELRELITQASHTHSNKDILDAITSPFTKEDRVKLDNLTPYDDSILKEKITALERLAHEHSNKKILDRTTASFTTEYERKMRWIRLYTGCTGMEEGIAGLVPAAQAGEEDYVLSGSGEWVPQTGGGGTYELPIATASTLGGIKVGDGLEIDANGKLSVVGGGGGDTITQGGGINVTTDPQTHEKIVSVNAGTGLAIDQQTGELYVTGGGGGDSIAEGGGISINTDPQTGVKTISVNTGDHLSVDSQTGELNVTDVDYEAGQGIHIGSDYTLIEYIKNSGNYDQIILTDIIPLSTDKIELDLKFGIDTGLADNRRIIGAYFTNITPPEVLQIHIEAQSSANPKNIGFYNHFEWRSGIGSVPYIERPTDMDNTEANQRQILSINQTTGTWGNQSTNFGSVIDSSYGELTHPIAIFGCVSNDINSPFVSKQVSMYGVKIYNSSDVLIHDLRPAERGIDGEAGLYDLITHKFYGNAGNGSFVKGPPVSSVDDRLISAKIGNGLQFDSNDAIEVNIGDGLSINQDNELEVNTGNGLSINQNNELDVGISNGLQFDSNNEIEINTGNGLSINQDNELEVNIGTGLEIDPQTGAINVTETGGDTVETGDGIDIDTDAQTGNKVISVVTGNGLEINNDNEVEVNIGDGLTLDANDKITIDEDIVPLTHYFPGTAITFDQRSSAEVDIWNNGNGWANGAYISLTGNGYLAGFGPEYHSPIGNDSLEVPTNVTKLRVIALSANDDVLSVTVHCLDASHNRYLTLYDDTQPYDAWIDLDASARYVNFGVRWTLNSNVSITGTDIKSVTLYWQSSGSGDLDVDFKNISVNYGDGLTVNQDNELEVNIDAGDGIDITTDSQTGNKVISTIVQENGGLTIDEDTNGLKLDQSAAGKAINISDEITFDSWNNGTGWANEEYYDNTSDRHIPWGQNLMIYPTSTDVLFRIPDGVTQAKCSATSVSPSISLKTGLYFYNAQGAHFAGPTRSTDPDTIIDIPAGSVYVNQSIRKVNDTNVFSDNVAGATITWLTGGTKIDVKYGTGLALNQDNELEVNIGDGLEIDPDTGAINVTGGGGGGDSIAEGDGISITDDLQTGDKIISVNYGTGLTIDTETGALIVDGQLPEGTIIRKMTIMGDGGATNNIQFEKKPVAIMSIYGNGLGGNHISSTSAPIDSPILMGAYGAGGRSSGGIVSCAMSYNDSTNVLSLTGGPDAGARYNMANETYTVYYLTKGHTGDGTSETNEVSVVKTFSYVGTGTATNNIQFPETPNVVLSIYGPLGTSGAEIRTLAIDTTYPSTNSEYFYEYWQNGSGYMRAGTYSFNDTTNILSLVGPDYGASLNYSGLTYIVRYIVNETISSGGGGSGSYEPGTAIEFSNQQRKINPVMTSDVLPYGEVIESGYFSTRYGWNAFDGTDSQTWSSHAWSDGTNQLDDDPESCYVGYVFPEDVYLTEFVLSTYSDRTYTGIIQVRSEGTWTTVVPNVSVVNTGYIKNTYTLQTPVLCDAFRFCVLSGAEQYFVNASPPYGGNVCDFQAIGYPTGASAISVKYGDGLTVNQDNELEVNLGSGLQFDANGAIEVTGGGGGSGDTVAEGDGISITTDAQTGDKVIAVNAGAGLQVNQTTNELEVSSGVVTSISPTQNTPGSITVTEGDGTTTPVSVINQMGGATSSTAGTAGYVPAPASGDDDAYLRGDGTWDDSVLTEDDELTLVFVPDDYQPS